MANRIFSVDLSQGAADFVPTATEPGLGMLDRAGANYEILKRWFGNLIAEPEWHGDKVDFYAWDLERGRLEDVLCYPVVKSDLDKTLKDEVEAIRAKIAKARPSSTTEQTLHGIVARTFKKLIDNPEASDFDSYFFKCRAGREDWHLVWCWGYQRGDQQPATALICTDPECNQLFVRRPNSKGVCPGCNSEVKRRRQKVMGGSLSTVAILLLFTLAALFFYFNQPKLVVSPEKWGGPPGSRVDFKANYKRWYFFNTDVTRQVAAVSNDPAVVELDRHGTAGRARKMGETFVTFRYSGKVTDVKLFVGPAKPPKSLTIEPERVKLGIYSTARLKVLGHYDDGPPVDLTESVRFAVKDDKIATFNEPYLEGASEGATTVKATYYVLVKKENMKWDEQTIESPAATIEVVKVDYKKVQVGLDPTKLAIGQSGKLAIDALDQAGAKYSVLGSSQLNAQVTPDTVATLEAEYVVGKSPGDGQVKALFIDKLEGTLAFKVTNESVLPAGMFEVSPTELALYVGEYKRLEIRAASSDPITSVSSNPDVLEVIGQNEITGRAAGTAQVTLTQGDKKQTVSVTVKAAEYVDLDIDPSEIHLTAGKPKKFKVLGTTKDGATVEISPREISWSRQPLLDYASLDDERLEMFGIKPTTEPQKLVAVVGGKEALALVHVARSTSVGEFDLPDDFLVYPPIGTVVDNGMVVSANGIQLNRDIENGVLSTLGLPPGTVITGVNGTSLVGQPLDRLKHYLSEDVLRNGSIKYRLPNGEVVNRNLSIGVSSTIPVKFNSVRAVDATVADFRAELEVELLEAAEYRVTDTAGTPLGEYQQLGPLVRAKITSDRIARTPGDEYSIVLERRMGTVTKKFPFSFEVKASKTDVVP